MDRGWTSEQMGEVCVEEMTKKMKLIRRDSRPPKAGKKAMQIIGDENWNSK
jgi:hypothetical protein